MTPLAAYLLLFVAVGSGFILVHLVLGKLIRPSRPDAEKETIYECGEPTIGSAWVQFDLRYYVVALLFVIFDVEVAFFFPWAEVFGKANAVANSPEPKDAAGYRKAAAAVLDLAPPAHLREGSGRTAAPALERSRWEALEMLTQEGLTTFRSLSEADRDRLKEIPDGQVKVFKGLPKEARATMKVEAERLAPVLKEVASGRRAAVEAVKKALIARKQPQEAMQGFTSEDEDNLGQRPLAQLKTLPLLLEPPSVGPGGQPVRPWLARNHRGLLKQADAEAARLQKTLSAAVAESEVALAKVFGSSSPSAGQLSQRAMATLGSLEEGPAEALRSGLVTPDLIRAMRERNIAVRKTDETQAPSPVMVNAMWHDARIQARTLAWLALIEVLVFFGVLLVGFAYLWRRGDIEWVRSTAAEKPEHVDDKAQMTGA